MATKQSALTADNKPVIGATYRDPATGVDYTSKTRLGAIPRFLKEARAAGVPVSKFLVNPGLDEAERFTNFIRSAKHDLMHHLDVLRARLLLQSDIRLTKPVINEIETVTGLIQTYQERDIDSFRELEGALGPYLQTR